MARAPKAGEDAYIFGRSDAELTSTVRLNYQHWLSLRVCGHLVHPSIPKDSPDIRVADVGAGSAIWAIDLADELAPTVRIDAIDLSDTDFPHPAWIPQNVHLSKHDCFQPFPKDLVEQFDIIHVRFWCTIVRTDTLEPLLRNLMTLLKPGGYIQWYEPDNYVAKVTTGPLSFPTPATDQLIEQFKKPVPGCDTIFVGELDKTFKEQGLEVIAYDRYPVRDVLRPHYNTTFLISYEAICKRFEQVGKLELAKTSREHMSRLLDEFRNGAVVEQEFVFCVGRKPT